MKKRFLSLLMLPLLAFGVAACSGNGATSSEAPAPVPSTSEEQPIVDDYKLTMLSPQGAPAATFYTHGANENFVTVDNPKLIPPNFKQATKDMIIFDFYNGLKAIKGNNADYKLARVLTGANLYLVGVNTKAEPKANDKIVMFGENLLPDLVFKKIFTADERSNVTYVDGVKQVLPIAVSGKVNKEPVNYVVIAQPLLNVAIKTINEKQTGVELTVIDSFKNMWHETTGQENYPQAGLFIKQSAYAAHKSVFDTELDAIDDRMNKAVNDVDTAVAEMNDALEVDKQAAKFGFNSTVMKAVQTSKLTPNGFALLTKEAEAKISIPAFLEQLGKGNEDYSAYIM